MLENENPPDNSLNSRTPPPKDDIAIDRIIQDAFAAGKFDNLPGKGKPLSDDDNPYAEPGSWAANRLLKSAGFALPWMEERKEIEQEIVTARASLIRSWRWFRDTPPDQFSKERWDKAQSAFREKTTDLNNQIRTHNLKVPMSEFHMMTLDVESEITKVLQQA